MKQKTKPSRLMLLIAGTVLALTGLNDTFAQTTSYDANTVPISGTKNCGIGVGVLSSNTTGSTNVGIGTYALTNNTTGAQNVAAGYQALYANTTGYSNVGIGHTALKNSTGDYNVAVGTGTLSWNTTGRENVAVGFATISGQSTGSATGSYNVGIGAYALSFNLAGSSNTAAGHSALYSNTSGAYNTATGGRALYSITSGNRSCAYGYQALTVSTGGNNTAIGFRSLYANTTGIENTACGMGALISNTTGNNNSGLGIYADVGAGNLTNATAIGNLSVCNASNKVRIGNASVTVIEGQVPFSNTSDGRFKTNITEEDVKGLEFIKKLRPVVYNLDTRKLAEFQTKNMPDSIRQHHLAQDFDASTKIRQSGFIAQEVEKAAKAVQYNFNGVHVPANPEEENYSIAYSQFVVPLVKGMQEQQQMIEQQQQLIAGQNEKIEKLQQQLDELLNSKEQTPTGIEQQFVPGASLEQNVPNPFTHETVIGFTLPQDVRQASMNVYDLSGKQLKSLPIQQRGAASMTITADQLAAGMYIYSIVADGKLISSKRMVVAEK